MTTFILLLTTLLGSGPAHADWEDESQLSCPPGMRSGWGGNEDSQYAVCIPTAPRMVIDRESSTGRPAVDPKFPTAQSQQPVKPGTKPPAPAPAKPADQAQQPPAAQDGVKAEDEATRKLREEAANQMREADRRTEVCEREASNIVKTCSVEGLSRQDKEAIDDAVTQAKLAAANTSPAMNAMGCVDTNGVADKISSATRALSTQCSEAVTKCTQACESANELWWHFQDSRGTFFSVKPDGLDATLKFSNVSNHFNKCTEQGQKAERYKSEASSYARTAAGSAACAGQSALQNYNMNKAKKAGQAAFAAPVVPVSGCGDPNYRKAHWNECVCAANSKAPGCGDNMAGGSMPGISSGLAGARGGNAEGVKGLGVNGDFSAPGDSPILGGASGSKASNVIEGGNAGGPQGLIGGAAGGAPQEDGGGGPLGPDRQIILGVGSSGTGAPSYGRRGVAGASGGSGSIGLDRYANYLAQKKMNIRAHLPSGSQYVGGVAGRGPASTDKIGVDGITGSTGPSLWEKVTRQYLRKKDELLP